MHEWTRRATGLGVAGLVVAPLTGCAPPPSPAGATTTATSASSSAATSTGAGVTTGPSERPTGTPTGGSATPLPLIRTSTPPPITTVAPVITQAAGRPPSFTPPPVCPGLALHLVIPRSAAANTQRQAYLELSQATSPPCSLTGWPTVTLLGPNDPQYGPHYELPRTNEVPAPVLVAPGRRARVTVTFLPPESSEPHPWVPTSIALTLPGSRTTLSAPWPAGTAVLRQDAASHPGTYAGPARAVG